MTGPDPEEARRRYDRFAPTYDRQLKVLRSIQGGVRRRAVARLGLVPGSTVIDVGCGTGLSLPMLVDAVGSTGRVIGVDQSEGMLKVARRRVDVAGWDNVELLCSPADRASVSGPVDAALLFFTHDLLRTPSALDRVVAVLRPHGRIVTAGGRRPPGWIVPLALPVLLAMRRYVTATDGFVTPWDLLAERVEDLEVDLSHLGVIYTATGRPRTQPATSPSPAGTDARTARPTKNIP